MSVAQVRCLPRPAESAVNYFSCSFFILCLYAEYAAYPSFYMLVLDTLHLLMLMSIQERSKSGVPGTV